MSNPQSIKRSYTLNLAEAQDLAYKLSNPEQYLNSISSDTYREKLAICNDNFCHAIPNPNPNSRATLFHGNRNALITNIEQLKQELNSSLSLRENAVTCNSHHQSNSALIKPSEIQIEITVNTHNQVQSIVTKTK